MELKFIDGTVDEPDVITYNRKSDDQEGPTIDAKGKETVRDKMLAGLSASLSP